MTKKKGIAVVSGSGDVAFKFLDDGTSVLGKDENSTHAFTGSVNVSGTLSVQGSLSMTDRLGGYKFGLPYLDGVDDASTLDLLNVSSSAYSGFMFYLNNMANRVCKLLEIQNINKETKDYEVALDVLKTKVFWKDKPIYIQQLKRWSNKNLEILLNKIGKIELLMKKNSQIRNDVLIKNLLINICNRASSSV